MHEFLLAMLFERRLTAYAKSIDPVLPAHFAQADLGQIFLVLVNFPCGPVYIMIESVV